MSGEVFEMTWALATNDIGVMLSVAQLLEHAKKDSQVGSKFISITIEM